MAVLDLAFASKDTSLTVRTFWIKEGISKLFEVSVVARSEVHDLDLDQFIGKGAALVCGSGVPSEALKGSRTWHGVASHMEQVSIEADGLSTYYIRIVPDLWRTTLRKNARVFQGKSIPEIVTSVLSEWDIKADLKLNEDHAKHEYKVQYGETDFVFVNRLLEEAGISFYFEHGEVAHGEKAGLKDPSRLVLHDAPHKREHRAGGPIRYHDQPSHSGQKEYVSKVKLAHKMKPGRVTVRDFDFRTRSDYQLLAEARQATSEEERYEHFHYHPGSFMHVEAKRGETPVADDRGAARADEKHAKQNAQKMLDGERNDRRRVTFSTNVIDLSPGVVASMAEHPRPDLAEENTLLVTDSTIEGSHDGDWNISCGAAFTSQTWRPQRVTEKQKVYGVQSAIVVGPAGEEIHTDEFGRVRVQFHWDRQGNFDEMSSCWIRVSQSWAGSSYGMLSVPRVGQEVLVEFFEGDPDRPIITGRVYNNTTRVPYKLPEDKTKSGWKTSSSPGADGFSELMFDDKKGKELVFFQAQKDLSSIIKESESRVVGKNRATNVGADDAITIGANMRIDVAQDRAMTVGGSESIEVLGSRATAVAVSETVQVGESYALALGAETGIVIQDGKMTVTNGKASIVISGSDIFFDAAGDETISAGGKLTLSGKEVTADASPMVMLNCSAPVMPNVVKMAKSALMRGVKDVEKEANHLVRALEMDGQGLWALPGKLLAAVEDAPDFVKLDGDIFGEIKKDVAALKKEAALIKKKIQPYLHYVRLVENLIEHHDWTKIEKEALHLLGLDELDGMLGGVNKHKLYGGNKGGHGPGTHHPGQPHHPGQGGGHQPHHPGQGGGQQPHHPGQGGGQQPHHPGQGGGHQPHHPGQGGGQQPHHPGQGGGQQPHHPGQGGGHQPHHPGQGGGHQPHHPGQGGGQQPHHPGQGGGHQPHHPGQGGGQHHPGQDGQHHGGQHHRIEHASGEQAHEMHKTLGPKLGPKVATDTHKTAAIHESMQGANLNHDVASPALLGQSWNRPMPPASQASPQDLGQVVNGMGQVQVFHVASTSATTTAASSGAAVAGGAAAAGGVALAGGAAAVAMTSSSDPKQYMALKTAQTPYQVDEDQLHQQQQRYVASGMSDEDATAKALHDNGMALYEGDGAGNFRKVPVAV